MRFLVPRLIAAIVLTLAPATGRAFSDAELIDGFERTVFGSEYASFGWQSRLVKKFTGPVRFYVDDRSTAGRGADVVDFVRMLPQLIAGLDVKVVSDPDAANYRVFVLDRADYRQVITSEVYERPTSTFAPGRCLVRVVSSMSGISRSDAVIVADEGDFLFRRCMVEEILQGLGPVNDDRSLIESVFNDQSLNAEFTLFDRHILNMLYDPRVAPGMTKLEAGRVLPDVAADVRAALEVKKTLP
jgi:hypothetical protein